MKRIKTANINKRKNFLPLILGFIFAVNLSGQTTPAPIEAPHKNGIEIGFNHALFSLPSQSIYLGYNRSHKLNHYFAMEFQTGASYSKFTNGDDFFARANGTKYTLSTYAGIKSYIIPPKYAFRMYFQTLVGGHLQFDYYTEEERKDTVRPALDLSVGLFGEWQNVYAGISTERVLDNLIFKLGYRF